MAITLPYKDLGEDPANSNVSDTGKARGGGFTLDLPDGTTEIWIRYDCYNSDVREYGFSVGINSGDYWCGFRTWAVYGARYLYISDENARKVFTLNDIKGKNSYVLHIKGETDGTNGIVEFYIGDNLDMSANGNVAGGNGGVLKTVSFNGNRDNVKYSDIVISAQPLTVYDHSYRIVETEYKTSFYTKRSLSNVALRTFDTSRNVKNGYFVDQPFDTVRRVKGNINISFDTLRDVSNYLISAHYDGDLIRNVTKDVDASFDTKREVVPTADISFDTFREVDKTVEIEIPVKRTSWQDIDESFYTNRKIAFNFGKVEDRIGKDGGYHLRSIVLNLAANTLSDKITCEVAAHMKPNDAMIGSLLDYAFDMMVESATYKGVDPSINGDSYLQRVTSMYKMDALLTVPRRLKLTRYSVSASFRHVDIYQASEWVTDTQTTAEKKDIAKRKIKFKDLKYSGQTLALSIAKSLGLIPAIYFDNFKSETAYSLQSQTTYKAMLSNNFGWSSSLPWRQINIFIRKNILCFVQRGKEPNEINLDEYTTTTPEVRLSIYRTEWNILENSTSYSWEKGDSGDDGDKDDDNDWPDDDPENDDSDKDKDNTPSFPRPVYFSGTLICGNTTLAYESGLCVAKTVLSPMDMKTVTYHGTMDYDELRRIVDKHEYSDDGTYTETHIDYAGGTDNTSNTTTERSYSAEFNAEKNTYDIGDMISETITVSVDLGNGFVGVSTYVDGEYQGSSISGSGVISNGEYQTNESNKKLAKGKNGYEMPDGTTEKPDEPKKSKVPDVLQTSTLPKSLLDLFADEIRSYNRSIQETISLNVISPVVNGKIKDKHIIDFTDRILYRGNTYYLESNTVTLNMSSFTQALTFTRWRR